MLASVNVRTEFNTFLTQFAYSRERKYLKASAVCKHWTVKSVELMQSSSLFKDLKSRTQIKMIADELYFSTGESVSTVINGVKSDLEETKTEFQGKIDTVDSKVEGIQIGVRNLLLKSNVEISNQETYMGKMMSTLRRIAATMISGTSAVLLLT